MIALMQTTNFTEKVLINLDYKTIFEILIDPARHSHLVGANVKINPAPNSDFSVGGDEPSITGYVIEAVPNNKILLQWQLIAPEWPSDHFSTVHIEFVSSNGRTWVHLTHNDIPTNFLEIIKSGWKEFYWDPLLKLT